MAESALNRLFCIQVFQNIRVFGQPINFLNQRKKHWRTCYWTFFRNSRTEAPWQPQLAQRVCALASRALISMLPTWSSIERYLFAPLGFWKSYQKCWAVTWTWDRSGHRLSLAKTSGCRPRPRWLYILAPVALMEFLNEGVRKIY